MYLPGIPLFKFNMNGMVAMNSYKTVETIPETGDKYFKSIDKDVLIAEQDALRASQNVLMTVNTSNSNAVADAFNQIGHEPSGMTQFRCNSCDYATEFESALRAHMRKHLRKKIHRCEVCDGEFPSDYYSKKHAKNHPQCTKCHKRFIDLDSKKAHESTCFGLGFGCGFCKYNTLILTDFIKHVRIHVHKKKFRCSICKKNFVLQHNLDIHKEHRHGC